MPPSAPADHLPHPTGGAIRFVAHQADPAVIAQAEALAPTNPFAAAPYLAAQTALGFAPWALGLARGEVLEVVTFGFLRRGRLNASLEIATAPDVDADSPFWSGLRAWCRSRGISRLTVNSFASARTAIPALGDELSRYARTEFVLDLTVDDLMGPVGRTHRERIKKARKQGVVLRRTRDLAALGPHLGLHDASMTRRLERGESVPLNEDSRGLQALLRHGNAELFQAYREEELLGSIMVLRARSGAYSCSSGNSPEGMRCGASHFLTFETAQILKDEGLAVFNRSGARPHETGLADFKRRFGARCVELESASFDLSGPVRRTLTRLADVVQRSRARPAHG